MDGYKDTAELANDCDKEQYERLCEEMKKAKTKEDWINLADKFRGLTPYANTLELANLCDYKYRTEQYEEWSRMHPIF